MSGEGRYYWEAIAERALRTWAQAALAAIVVTGADDLGGVPWWGVISTATLAALISVLMSIAGSKDGNPSWGSVERVRGVDDDRYSVTEHGDG